MTIRPPQCLWPSPPHRILCLESSLSQASIQFYSLFFKQLKLQKFSIPFPTEPERPGVTTLRSHNNIHNHPLPPSSQISSSRDWKLQTSSICGLLGSWLFDQTIFRVDTVSALFSLHTCYNYCFTCFIIFT